MTAELAVSPTKPVKVLFVVENYYPLTGGAEILFQHLAEEMVHRGQQVTVVTSCVQGAISRETVNGVKIIRLPLPRFFTRYWFTLLAVFWLLRMPPNEYDLIQTTTYNAALPAWLCAKIRRRPAVLIVHEVWGRLWFSLGTMSRISAIFHWLFEYLVIHLPFSAYVAVSEATKTALQQAISAQRKIIRIYNGIDYELFNPAKKFGEAKRQQLNLHNDYVFLYFGRPGWAKGVADLLEAFVLVRATQPAARLLLLLSRQPEALYRKLLDQIIRLGLKDVVTVHKPVERQLLPQYIAVADCVVVPSRSEGFGFTAAEASAMGIPVIASRAGSLPEVVSGRYRFFQTGDIADLAKAMVAAGQNQFEQSELKKFSWIETTGEYLGLYGQLLGKNSA